MLNVRDSMHLGMQFNRVIVLDNGSSVLKIGIAGDDEPKALIPSIVSDLQNKWLSDPLRRQSVSASEASFERGINPSLSAPISRGVVTSWPDMELLWNRAFETVEATPPEHAILLTEPPFNPLSNREKLCEVLFETYDAPALHIAIPAVLSMYASGRATGVVLDIGNGVTHVVPIDGGYTVRSALKRVDLGGADLTDYLARLSAGRSSWSNSLAERELVRNVKEKVCYVKTSGWETDQAPRGSWQLPDGQEITIGDESFQVAEALFNPGLIGSAVEGVQDIVQGCIQRCDIDLRRLLYNNIILSGGTTHIPGFPQRLRSEIMGLANLRIRVTVVPPSSDPKFSPALFPWVGGSILGSLSTFPLGCVSRQEYDEIGLSAVHCRITHDGNLGR